MQRTRTRRRPSETSALDTRASLLSGHDGAAAFCHRACLLNRTSPPSPALLSHFRRRPARTAMIQTSLPHFFLACLLVRSACATLFPLSQSMRNPDRSRYRPSGSESDDVTRLGSCAARATPPRRPQRTPPGASALHASRSSQPRPTILTTVARLRPHILLLIASSPTTPFKAPELSDVCLVRTRRQPVRVNLALARPELVVVQQPLQPLSS
jgi:hypothetical protein